jgi:hypothetical protein
MKSYVKTILTAAIAGSTAIAIYAANDQTSSQNSSDQSSAQKSDQASGSASQSGSQSSGQKLLLDQVPKAVQKTLLQHSAGANPENIRRITQNGKQCYTATVDRPDFKGKLTVAQDGSLLAIQQSEDFAIDVQAPQLEKSQIRFTQLPKPVQETITKEAGSAHLGNLSESEVNGQTLYRADFDHEGVRNELFVTPQGKVAAAVQETSFAIQPMDDVRSLSINDTPQSVQKAAQSNASGGKITDVDAAKWHGQQVYSVMVDKNGRLSQWIFDENGKAIEQPGRQIPEAAGAQNSNSTDQNGQPQQSQDQNAANQQQRDQSQGQQSPK